MVEIGESENKKPENIIDFTENIKSLEKRADVAFNRVKWIGSTLTTVMIGLVIAIVIFYGNADNAKIDLQIELIETKKQALNLIRDRENALIGALDDQGKSLVPTAFDIGSVESPNQSLVNLEKIVSLMKILESPQGDLNQADSIPQMDSSTFASSFSTIAFSIAAIGFAVLLIQIAVQFMRYYARLAELYEAQANALKASNGSPTVAYEFVSKFSSELVEIGSAPATVYEKALDTVAAISKR